MSISVRKRWILIAVVAALAGWYFGGPFVKREVPILMYHHIGVDAQDVWSVSPSDFERQMRQLKDEGYETVLPSDLVAYTQHRKSLPKKPVVITFDDGSQSVKEWAYPILKRHGYRAMVYLITEATADEPENRKESEGHPCLTWSEVREMKKEGTFAFGAHTVHRDRALLVSQPALEIEQAYREIENKAGSKPDSFSYPYNQGAGNPAIEELVRRAGYTSAVCCTEKRARIRGKSGLLHLPRLWVRGGQHLFNGGRIEPEGGEGQIIIRILHAGFPLPVTPRFVWPGMQASDGWLPTSEIRTGHTLWSSLTAGVPKQQANVGFEVWDKNRFFRLFAWKPESQRTGEQGAKRP